MTITVPFPWESPASGVERPDYKGAGWYEREFTIPADWQGLTPYLNFGAVDWHARVWINGQLAGEHENGYLPFSIDLSHCAARPKRYRHRARMMWPTLPRWWANRCRAGIPAAAASGRPSGWKGVL
ncbi:MAG: hypothetical protein R2911_39355 [Caldilineaceae bacterium]